MLFTCSNVLVLRKIDGFILLVKYNIFIIQKLHFAFLFCRHYDINRAKSSRENLNTKH